MGRGSTRAGTLTDAHAVTPPQLPPVAGGVSPPARDTMVSQAGSRRRRRLLNVLFGDGTTSRSATRAVLEGARDRPRAPPRQAATASRRNAATGRRNWARRPGCRVRRRANSRRVPPPSAGTPHGLTPSPNREPVLVRESSCPAWGWKGFSYEEATQRRADREPASPGGR